MRDTPYISVFSSNAGKYGPEKTPYLDTFHAVILKLNWIAELELMKKLSFFLSAWHYTKNEVFH